MNGSATATAFLAALDRAREEAWPFRHWMLRDVIDPATLAGLKAWPHDAPDIRYAAGRREENNATRRYVDAAAIAAHPAARALADGFQDGRVTAAVEARCGASLDGTSLRIEYAQDSDGFWLEPHTDIGVKSFTMFIYLDDGEGGRDLGTDLFRDSETHATRLPFDDNAGMIFIPGHDTWHGFRERPIDGVRRSLIVNYVTGEWRNRHELAWPDRPVG